MKITDKIIAFHCLPWSHVELYKVEMFLIKIKIFSTAFLVGYLLVALKEKKNFM